MKNYKTKDVLEEIRATTTLKITDRTWSNYKKFFGIRPRQHHLTRGNFLDLLSLVKHKEKFGISNRDPIVKADLYAVIEEYRLEDYIDEYDARKISRKDLIITTAKKFKLSRDTVRDVLRMLYGGYAVKMTFSKVEVIDLHRRFKK